MRKKLKEFIKYLICAWIISILFFGLCCLGEYKMAIIMICMVTIMFGSILLAVLIGNKVNLFWKKNKSIQKDKNYEREIPKSYTVSMASLLLDNVFEDIVDIPAIILSLIGKNVLSYEEKMLIAQPLEGSDSLYNHEKYVYKCIKEKKKIQPKKFRKYVIEDALMAKYIKKNVIKDPFYKSVLIFLSLAIVGFVCTVILTRLPEFLYYSIVMICFFAAITSPISIFNKYDLDIENPYKNTKLGNKEVRTLLGLKNYLKDFSMLNEKEIKEVILWEDYLAYAYMFGLNKKIFEEFKELKQIKDIIN